MAELKKPRVRAARERDVGLFRKLWTEFLLEQEKLGSIIKGSEKNVELYVDKIFKRYVEKDESGQSLNIGVVLFVGEIAVLMVGDPGNGIEFTVGLRPVNVFGIYITPDHRGKGIGAMLYTEAFKQLKAMGFDLVLGNVLNDNISNLKSLEKVVGIPIEVPERPFYAKLTSE